MAKSHDYELVMKTLSIPLFPFISRIFVINDTDLIKLLSHTEYALIRVMTSLLQLNRVEFPEAGMKETATIRIVNAITHIFSYRTTIISQLEYNNSK